LSFEDEEERDTSSDDAYDEDGQSRRYPSCLLLLAFFAPQQATPGDNKQATTRETRGKARRHKRGKARQEATVDVNKPTKTCCKTPAQ
jgi:hypothetical protein